MKELKHLSVSQVSRFDAKQYGGCPRAWWFEFNGDKPEETAANIEGTKGHALLETYFKTGEGPKGRVKMGKTVSAAILNPKLPKPGADLLVEARFSGQAKYDPAGEWISLDPALTPIRVGGLPWDGFIDLAWRRGQIPDVLDHKFSADIDGESTKRGDQLIDTVQMPVYVLRASLYWPDATDFRISHHYVSRSGCKSDLRSQIVSLDLVHERIEDVARVVGEMRGAATVESQEDVPYNRGACSAYFGCPHQSRCSAFPKGETKVSLSPEELALFGEDPAPVAAPQETPKAPVMVSSEAPKPDLVPPPKPKVDLIMPECADCGAALNPDNASKLRGGKGWKHMGCPKAASEEKKPPQGPEDRPTIARAGDVVLPTDGIRLIAPTVSATPPPVQGATTITHVYELGPDTRAFLLKLAEFGKTFGK